MSNESFTKPKMENGELPLYHPRLLDLRDREDIIYVDPAEGGPLNNRESASSQMMGHQFTGNICYMPVPPMTNSIYYNPVPPMINGFYYPSPGEWKTEHAAATESAEKSYHAQTRDGGKVAPVAAAPRDLTAPSSGNEKIEKIRGTSPDEDRDYKSSTVSCKYPAGKLCPEFHTAHHDICCYLLAKLCEPRHHPVPDGLEIRHHGLINDTYCSDEVVSKRVAWLHGHRHFITRKSQSVLLDRAVQAWKRILDHKPDPPLTKYGLTREGNYDKTRQFLIHLAYAAQYQYHVDLLVPTSELPPHLATGPDETETATHYSCTHPKAEAATREPHAGSKIATGPRLDAVTQTAARETNTGPSTNQTGSKDGAGPQADVSTFERSDGEPYSLMDDDGDIVLVEHHRLSSCHRSQGL